MELRDHTISVLRRHGVIRTTKAALYMVELVDIYVLDSADLLMSKMFRDVAQRHGIEVTYLFHLLRNLALRIRRKDPVWYGGAFPERYTARTFVQTVAREAQASQGAWDG